MSRVTIALLCVLVLIVAWMLRWEIIAVQQHDDRPSYAYALDRWTGKIWFLQGDWSMEVEEFHKEAPGKIKYLESDKPVK